MVSGGCSEDARIVSVRLQKLQHLDSIDILHSWQQAFSLALICFRYSLASALIRNHRSNAMQSPALLKPCMNCDSDSPLASTYWAKHFKLLFAFSSPLQFIQVEAIVDSGMCVRPGHLLRSGLVYDVSLKLLWVKSLPAC